MNQLLTITLLIFILVNPILMMEMLGEENREETPIRAGQERDR